MDRQKSGYDRRNFLTRAAAGLAAVSAAGLWPGKLLAQEKENKTETGNKKIIYRRLGKTDINVPVISMGVMNSSAPQIVQSSYEQGVRLFDTAASYQFGRNEQMVGNVINRLGVRKEVVVGTKIYSPQQRLNLSREEGKKKFITLLEGSLSRLHMAFADILYVHDVSSKEEVNDPAVLEALKILKEQGKIRYAGVATHSNMAEVIRAVAENGHYEVVLTAFNFTMDDETPLLDAIREAAAQGVGIIAMKTLAGGSRWPNPETRRANSNSTIARAALKWVLHNENITTAIPGYDNFEHLQEDFAVAYDLEYTPEEKKFLNDNDIKLSMGFCRQCRTCLASCPYGVEIPALMRTHMYAAQYGNFLQARQTLDDIPSQKSLINCTSCDRCTARCAHSVDIARRIEELKLIYA